MMLTKGIIVATDSRLYECALLLVKTIRFFHKNIPIVVNDLGMSEAEKQEMAALGGIELVVPQLDHVKSMATGTLGDWYGEDWKYWAKPFILAQSKFDLTLWIDADCIVIGNLDQLFKDIEEKEFVITREYFTEVAGCSHAAFNHPQIYVTCHVSKQMEVPIGAGVIGFSTKTIIDKWASTCSFLLNNRHLPYISWFDQGALILTLEIMGMPNIRKSNVGYNYTLQAGQRQFTVENLVVDIPHLRMKFPEGVILHYCGKPKMYRATPDKWCFEKYDEQTQSWKKKG